MSDETLALFEGPEIGMLESEVDERKESWTEDCLKALAALANTQGGTLWIGVKDGGTVIGWNGDGKEQEAISSKIVHHLHIHPASMSVVQRSGKPVLAIRMNQAASPVALRGRYFRRIGNSSHELPPEELPRFLLERTGQTWDALPAEEGIEALSVKTIADFKVLASKRLTQLSPSDTTEMILGKLKLLLPTKRVKRAAFLLFGEDPQRLTPNSPSANW